MILVAEFFVYLLVSCFHLLKLSDGHQDANLITFGWLNFMWNMFYFTYMFALIVVGSVIYKNGRETATLIHKAINQSTNENLITHVCKD
jgi:membrane-anchored glycerophosphoryl diester phosphodiesterase (GDPDase)